MPQFDDADLDDAPLDDADLHSQKAALRKAQSARRRAWAEEHAEAAAVAMATQIDDIIKVFNLSAGDRVAGSWPIKSEIDSRPLLTAFGERGFATALPATPQAGSPLVFHEWQAGDALRDGLYGTSEPMPQAPICTPSVLLIPMLAFDADFYRLGYGGGFYDRSLAELRAKSTSHGGRVVALGLAYEAQAVARVPRGAFDARLDGIVTESGLRSADSRTL